MTGVLEFDRDALCAAPRLLAMACVCAGGGERLPRGAKIERLLARIGSGQAFTATLCGARIEAGEDVRLMRDVGEMRRCGTTSLAIKPGMPEVWDGRFLVWSDRPGVEVRPLHGLAGRLPESERRALKALRPTARAALPLFRSGESVTCPILAEGTWAGARELIGERFAGACGRFARESDLSRGSDGEAASGALS